MQVSIARDTNVPLSLSAKMPLPMCPRRHRCRWYALVGVAGDEDRHAGQDAHQGQVFDGLVGAAVLAEGDARVGEAELDVELRIADAVADLVIAAPIGKVFSQIQI